MQGTGFYSGSSSKRNNNKNCKREGHGIKMHQAEKFNQKNLTAKRELKQSSSEKYKSNCILPKEKAQTKKLQHDNKYERANKYCQGG